MKLFFSIALLFCILRLTAQNNKIILLAQGQKTNLRGLSITHDGTLYASGSNGKVAKSINGGSSWQWLNVQGFEKKDFRDITAFDQSSAIIMGIDTPAILLKTVDGGRHWQLVYKNNTPKMFLDAMDFCNNKNGIVIGDPINGSIFLAATQDGGDSWKPINTSTANKIQEGEAFFAASGTNIILKNKQSFYAISGGLKSRLYSKDGRLNLPIMQGQTTAGGNGLALFKNRIAVVGGDFINPSRKDSCFCISYNKGKTWHTAETPPNGYRSCVIFITKNKLVCCGLTGVDVSEDGGKNWRQISSIPFNTCQYNKHTHTVFFVGPNGSIGKWKL